MAQDTQAYVFVLFFAAVAILLVVGALTIGKWLRPHKPNAQKQSTYESGNEAIGTAQVKFHVRYYLYALLFVLFDVEVVFLLPWAVAYTQLGWFATIEMYVFLAMLGVGLVYAWRKKVLQWNSI